MKLLESILIIVFTNVSNAGELPALIRYGDLIKKSPNIQGKNIRVWSIRKNDAIRVNLVETSGELEPHKYWSLTPKFILVSMDAPYYKQTIPLAEAPRGLSEFAREHRTPSSRVLNDQNSRTFSELTVKVLTLRRTNVEERDSG